MHDEILFAMPEFVGLNDEIVCICTITVIFDLKYQGQTEFPMVSYVCVHVKLLMTNSL